MSYAICIFCRATKSITSTDIIESIRREEVLRSAQLSIEDSGDTKWKRVALSYEQNKRPVVFQYYGTGRSLSRIIDSAVDCVGDCASVRQHEVVKWLRASVQAVAIEIDAAGVPEDVGDAIDCVEAYLAFAFEGVIYAPDEGFYDEGLALICPIA